MPNQITKALDHGLGKMGEEVAQKAVPTALALAAAPDGPVLADGLAVPGGRGGTIAFAAA